MKTPPNSKNVGLQPDHPIKSGNIDPIEAPMFYPIVTAPITKVLYLAGK